MLDKSIKDLFREDISDEDAYTIYCFVESLYHTLGNMYESKIIRYLEGYFQDSDEILLYLLTDEKL